jgi:hypothetical protein
MTNSFPSSLESRSASRSKMRCCCAAARTSTILDDIAYVTKAQAETSVLFELIATRYERRSLLITANQPFGEWGKIFADQAMTLATIDRLVHHATILEMNVESYRRKAALKRKSRSSRLSGDTAQPSRDVAGSHGDHHREPVSPSHGSHPTVIRPEQRNCETSHICRRSS